MIFQPILLIIFRLSVCLVVLLPLPAQAWRVPAGLLKMTPVNLEAHAAPVIRVNRNWPEYQAIEDTKTMQRALRKLGFYRGSIDGQMGPAMTSALRNLAHTEGYGLPTPSQDIEEIGYALEIVDVRNVSFSTARALVPELLAAKQSEIKSDELAGNGRFREAEDLLFGAIDTFSKLVGPRHRLTILARSRRAELVFEQGRANEAIDLLREIHEDAKRDGEPNSLSQRVLQILADMHMKRGHLSAAEVAYSEYFDTQTRIMASSLSYFNLTGLIDFGVLLMWRNRQTEAEILFRKLVGLSGIDGAEIDALSRQISRINLVWAVLQLGRLEEAERLAQEALRVEEAAPERRPAYLAEVYDILARIRMQKADSAGALAYQRKSFTILLKEMPDAVQRHGRSFRELAERLIEAGRPAEAEVMAINAINSLSSLVAETNPNRLRAVATTAKAHAALGDLPAAVRGYESLVSVFPVFLSEYETLLPSDMKNGRDILAGYLDALARTAEPTRDTVARSIVAQGWWKYGPLDAALTDLTARLRAGDEQDSELLRSFQEARDALSVAQSRFSRQFSVATAAAAAGPAISEQIRELRSRHDSLLERIRNENPAAAARLQPSAAPLEEVQSHLLPHEALVAIAVTEDHLYRWIVRQSGADWSRVEISREDLAGLVRGVRRGVDLGASPADPQPEGGCALTSPSPLLAGRAFDLCAAHDLYRTVLGGLDLAEVSSLIVVPDGPLEGIPFAVLVAELGEDTGPVWLIDQVSVSVLPTIASFRSFRETVQDRPAVERTRYLGLAPGTFSAFSKGTTLRFQPPDLPGTVSEVETIASVLGADTSTVLTGAAVHEAQVKSLEANQFDIVSLATHGLTTAEASTWTGGKIIEPALLMSGPGFGEDGILTASEVGKLKLDGVDLVLLSGCNTASSSGAAGAEGLSGLARAFFFAGARSLVASHWSVDDASAQVLMTQMLRNSAGSLGDLGRAAALRRAMQELKSRPVYAHPFFWGPFEFVGVDHPGRAPSETVLTMAEADRQSNTAVDLLKMPQTRAGVGKIPLRGTMGEAPAAQAAPLLVPGSDETEGALSLDRGKRREIQRRLTLLAFDTKGVDGVFGDGTRQSIQGWQRMKDLPATGFLTMQQLALLEADTEDVMSVWRSEGQKSSVRRGGSRNRSRTPSRHAGQADLRGNGGR